MQLIFASLFMLSVCLALIASVLSSITLMLLRWPVAFKYDGTKKSEGALAYFDRTLVRVQRLWSQFIPPWKESWTRKYLYWGREKFTSVFGG